MQWERLDRHREGVVATTSGRFERKQEQHRAEGASSRPPTAACTICYCNAILYTKIDRSMALLTGGSNPRFFEAPEHHRRKSLRGTAPSEPGLRSGHNATQHTHPNISNCELCRRRPSSPAVSTPSHPPQKTTCSLAPPRLGNHQGYEPGSDRFLALTAQSGQPVTPHFPGSNAHPSPPSPGPEGSDAVACSRAGIWGLLTPQKGGPTSPLGQGELNCMGEGARVRGCRGG